MSISPIYLVEPYNAYVQGGRKKHWMEIAEEEALMHRILMESMNNDSNSPSVAAPSGAGGQPPVSYFFPTKIPIFSLGNDWSPGNVNLSWTSPISTNVYEIWRKENSGAYSLLLSTSSLSATSSYVDVSADMGNSDLWSYIIRETNTGHSGEFSNPVLALDSGFVYITRSVNGDIATNDIVKMAYANNRFLASGFQVGSSKYIYTSLDGRDWTQFAIPELTGSGPGTPGWYRGVTWGNGTYVMVSRTGEIASSSDLLTWSIQAPNRSNLTPIIYAGGQFVVGSVVSSDGCGILTSPDGVTWALITTPQGGMNRSWQDVTYGNGLYVAVCNNDPNNAVMTSPDGVTWTLQDTSGANDNNQTWVAVTYGNGIFVAVDTSYAVNGIMTSPDGINWTLRASLGQVYFGSICFGNGRFFATVFDGPDYSKRMHTSIDGINWIAYDTDPNVDIFWAACAFGGGRFVAGYTGNGSGIMLTSG